MNATVQGGTAPSWRDFHIPLSQGEMRLREAREALAQVGAGQQEIPFMVQLAENPKYDLFHGAVDLETHDAIHLILGRGLLPKDEAFVIGFTMGSTHRLSATEEKLFTLIAKRLYPGVYRFNEDEVRVFRDAVRLGFLCDCPALNQVEYAQYRDESLGAIRRKLSIEEDLLRAYYRIEGKRYPDARESQRLLD